MWDHILGQARDELCVELTEQDGVPIGFALSGQDLFNGVLADDAAMLWVEQRNPRAIGFYHRNGFVFDGTEQADPETPGIVEARMIR